MHTAVQKFSASWRGDSCRDANSEQEELPEDFHGTSRLSLKDETCYSFMQFQPFQSDEGLARTPSSGGYTREPAQGDKACAGEAAELIAEACYLWQQEVNRFL